VKNNRHPTPEGDPVEVTVDDWFAEKENIGPHIRGKKIEDRKKAICIDVAPEGRKETVWIPKSVSTEPRGENTNLTQCQKESDSNE